MGWLTGNGTGSSGLNGRHGVKRLGLLSPQSAKMDFKIAASVAYDRTH